MELDTISQPELEQLERVGAADVVIGILDGDTPGLEDTAEARMREALTKFPNPLRAVVVSNNGIHAAAAAEPAGIAGCVGELGTRVFAKESALIRSGNI